MAPSGHRSWHEGPWHTCSRCGVVYHLSDMSWQRGLLLCNAHCYDYGIDPLIGDRELNIVRAFETPTHELEPDPKLTNPDVGTAGQDFIDF
jgi:predicted  nucleic acid-binding Zn-ribbon protein